MPARSIPALSRALAAASVAAVALLAPRPAGAAFSFLTTPTEQLGVPGVLGGTEVTPEGYLYTGYGELVFRAGPALAGWNEPIRTPAAGYLPIYTSSRRSGGVRYRLTVLSAPLAGQAVNYARVEIRNRSRRSATARWAVSLRHTGGGLKRPGLRRFRFARPATPERPGLYAQPGREFDPRATYAFDGDALTRDGRALYIAPPAPTGVRVARALHPHGASVGPTTEVGQTSYRVRLRPGAGVRLDFAMPVEPAPPGSEALAAAHGTSYASARASTVALWRAVVAPAMRVRLPEAKVRNTFYASLVTDAMARYRLPDGRWVQGVNKLQYQAFWLRDAAMITNAFDLAGMHEVARQNLDFFLDWQRPDGLFISRPDQYDGFGQALWAFAEHVRRTSDTALARAVLPNVRLAVDWFRRQRGADPLGLMPAASLAQTDNELVNGHLTGDNLWAFAGLRGAADVARAAGDVQTAGSWDDEAASFRANLDSRLGAATRRTGGPVPPAIDARGGQDWGNLWLAWPTQAYPSRHPWVGATLGHVRRKFRQGIATYRDGTQLHGYLGARVLETEVMRGEQERVARGLYAMLAHTTATHGGFEAGIGVRGSRSVDDNMTPHGWFAAEYVSLLRNMLVREEGRDVVLMSVLAPGWLRPGRTVALAGAPTTHGPVSFRLISRRGGATLKWSTRLAPGTRLRWPVPVWARGVHAPGLARGGRSIELRGSTGAIRVRWRLRPAKVSLRRAITDLGRR